MSGTDTLDDLERSIAGTLTAKADQLAVDVVPRSPFEDDGRTPATVILLTQPRPTRRRIAAVVAAACVIVAGLGVAARVRDGGSAVAPPAAAAVYGAPTPGIAGALPEPAPAGWSLATLAFGRVFDEGPRLWQLFGAGDTPPLDRGVLVGTERAGARVIEDATGTVHGRPARVGPSENPAHPAGAVTASWIEDGVVHDAVAVGLDEEGLVAFLDGLVPRADPLDGVDTADTGLPEVDAAVVGRSTTTSATYVRSDGTPGTLWVLAASVDPYGGLLHVLDGTDAPGGPRRSDSAGNVSQVRDDGWSIEVTAGPRAAPADTSVVDAFLAAARPMTWQQLTDVALAQPVTGTFDAGSGRTVELRGTPAEHTGLCLYPAAGPAVCGPAESVGGGEELVSSSLVVDGEWVLVTVSGADNRAEFGGLPDDADVTTESRVVDAPGRSGERLVVSLAHLPRDASAVDVMIATGEGTATGAVHENPL
jgi:hypothetical protein